MSIPKPVHGFSPHAIHSIRQRKSSSSTSGWTVWTMVNGFHMPYLIVATIPRRERSHTDLRTAAKNGSRFGKKTANVRKACASFQPCPMSLWDVRPSLPCHPLAVTYEGTAVRLPHIGQALHPRTNRCSRMLYQRLEQRFGLLQVRCVKPFGEPVVHRDQQSTSVVTLLLLLPQPAQTHRRA